MEVAVASLFRDSQVWHERPILQVERFFRQMDEQGRAADVDLSYFLLEGDSRDGTRAALEAKQGLLGHAVTLIKHDVGGSPPSSTGEADRYRCLSEVGNACLRAARDSVADIVFWVESDIVLRPQVLASLLDATQEPWWGETLAVAPVPVIRPHGNGPGLYDTWGFEGENGERWHLWQLGSLRQHPGRYRPMRSVGTCAVLNADLMRRHNIDFRDYCFRGLCQAGRDVGLKVWCDVEVEVEHPGSELVEGRWV
jgi:hypothetical protein